MAYLYVRKNGRVEIREARATARGPRSRTLASFKGALCEAHLDRAESAAAGRFDRDALCARARALGVPVARMNANAQASALIASLERGARLDPVLLGLLRERLAQGLAAPVPEEIADVVEWLGASDHERGRALRDVLRLYDRIGQSRAPVREPERLRYPRFEVRPGRQASLMYLDEKVALLARSLSGAKVPHAFGGAIALAYYATPRGTRDVDINLFLPARAFDRVLDALAPLDVAPPTATMLRTLERDGQVRLFWGSTPLDLFFSYNELHDACVERKRVVPFGADQIPILSAEDLAIFKVLFAREKDWRDLHEMLFAQAAVFDADYALGWLDRILAAGDERMRRFAALIETRLAE